MLGRIHDRRTIPDLQKAMHDGEDGVRLEIARTLVLMGDLQQSPILIAGLDSDRKEVRFMCHEALKSATGHDFGYDHLNQNQQELRTAVLQWRQWWGDYAGDPYFAQSYQDEHHIGAQLAAPAGETKPQDVPQPQGSQPQVPQAPVQGQQQTPTPTPEDHDAAPAEVEPTPAAEKPQPIEVPAQPTPVNGAETPQGYSSGVNNEANGGAHAPQNGVQPIVVPPVVVPKPVTGASGHGDGN